MNRSSSERAGAANGTTTLIAADTTTRGEIRGRGKTVVLGQMIGDCEIDGQVTVAAGGRWEGTLKVNKLIIAGTIEGDIIAKDMIEIEQTGKVAGTISCLSLRVAAGAIVNGQVTVRSNRD